MLMNSGVVTRNGVQTEFDDEVTKRIHILVHDVKPPFLDGRVVFTSQQEMVSVVKDPSSDLAVLAKQGSQLLRRVRELKDRNTMKNKFWEVAGSKIGDLMGVEKKEEETGDNLVNDSDQGEGENGEVNYKEDSQFAKHMSKKSDAMSEFSQNKTIKQQREYLPIYTVKAQLMQIISDNQIVVVIGETGSGKTTQMTQYLLEEKFATVGIIGCMF